MPPPASSDASAQTGLFRQRALPDPAAAAHWQHIIIPEPLRQMLLNYARLAMSADSIEPVVGGMYRFVVLQGEPGTGKSSFALGLANEVAKTFLPTSTSFWQLNAEAFFSEWEGRTPRLIHEGFELIRLAASRGPVVVLIDELEALAFERRKLLNSSDPSDLTRGVDTLLRELDDLRARPQLLVIGTTNFPEAVDQAVLDRSDLPQLRFPLPEVETRAAILADTFAAYQPHGLVLGPGAAEELAGMCEGISGRQLRKSVWLAQVMRGRTLEQLTLSDLGAAIAALMTGRTPADQNTAADTSEQHDHFHTLQQLAGASSTPAERGHVAPSRPGWSLGVVARIFIKTETSANKKGGAVRC